TGRKHAGQTDIKAGSSGANGNFRNHPFTSHPSIHPNDANAFRNYTEKFQYDKAGNVTSHQHIAKNSSWTRTFTYDEGNLLNNRLSSATVGSDTYHYTYDVHGNMNGLETVQEQ